MDSPSTDLHEAHDLAIRLAREAGALQVRERAGITAHAVKAHANDLVSHVDLASEALIVDGLRAAFPDDGVLGEEGGGVPGTSARRWIVDPLDGTRNYLSGSGPWSVCIALQDGPGRRRPRARGRARPRGRRDVQRDLRRGGFLDGAACDRLGSHRLWTRRLAGLSFDPSSATKQLMAGVIAALLPEVGDIRRLPSALDLAYLACGRFDCAVLAGTKLWDVAAGLLLAREAGVVLGGVDGHPSPALILAAAPGLWDAFSTGTAAEGAVRRATLSRSGFAEPASAPAPAPANHSCRSSTNRARCTGAAP